MASSWTNYAVEKVQDGVYAALHRRNGLGICNSGIVALGTGVLVFDTGCSIDSSHELWKVAEDAIGQPPTLAANSHWHLDHSLGNAQFSRVPIWGSRRTREILLEMGDRLTQELQKSELEKSLRELEARREGMAKGFPMRDLEFTIEFVKALLSSAGRHQLRPPDQTFDSRITLPGSRKAQLVSFGSGHTEADAFLYLPDERTIFAGDLVCLGIQPSMGSGDPAHWLTVLDQIDKLGIERVVPGHGPVSGPDRIQETREYVSGILEAARASTGAPLPAAIRHWEGSVSLEDNLTFARGWVAAHEGSR